MVKEEIDAEKFKTLILEMYDGFPNLIVVGKVEQVVRSDNIMRKLLDSGYLVRDTTLENGVKSVGYFLGPAALPLVSAWKTEELSRSIKRLTFYVIGLAVAAMVLSIILFFISK